MTVYNPDNLPALRTRLERQTNGLVVACYCAAWCDSCRAWQPEFTALATQWPQHAFVWIDIEDHPHLLGDEDVENFPTILIQNNGGNLFFGEQLPYVAHLDRLIRGFQASSPLIDSGPPLIRTMTAA